MLAARTATAGVPVVPTSSVNSFCFSWKIRTFHQLQLGLHPKGSSTGTCIFKPRGTLSNSRSSWMCLWSQNFRGGNLENHHEFRRSSLFSGTVSFSGWCTHRWLHPPGPSYATLAEVAIVPGLEGGSSTNCRCPGRGARSLNDFPEVEYGGIVHQSVYLSYSNICKEQNHGIYLCISVYIII